MEAWKSPLFGSHFHQTGYVVAATGRAPRKAIDHLEKALESIESNPTFAGDIRRLKGSQDFKKYTWQYSGPLTGFTGYFNRVAGYAHSADTLKGIWEHCAGSSIKFILGEEAGRVVELQYSGKQPNGTRRCTGAKTADGRIHSADLVICALGAHAASLIPEVGKFVVARCWSVAHVQLTEDEVNYLRGMPTTNIRDLGFFFEPDPKTRLFKLCPLGAGYTNTGKDGISLPTPDRLPPPQDFIPAADEQKLRRLLEETFPWMAARPFVDQKLCWFADTRDSEYCIDFVPNTEKSLVCISGDSGHGFKMMPVFGKWVVDLLAQGEQKLPRWSWREDSGVDQDWGGAISWRIGEGSELNQLIEAKTKLIRARL